MTTVRCIRPGSPPAEWLGSPRPRNGRSISSPTSRPAACTARWTRDRSRTAKAAGREPIRLHPEDADPRDIKTGDVVRVFNDRGACLAAAVLDDGVMPQVAVMATGAWFDPALRPESPSATAIPTCSRSTSARPA